MRDEVIAFKRDRIVKAAEKLFYQHGYDSTTVDAIAAELKTTKQFIYSYFDSKSEILFIVCQAGSALALEMAERISRSEGEPGKQLDELIRGFARVITQEKMSVAIFIREEKNLEPAHIAEINRRRRAFDQILSGILDEGQSKGLFQVDDTQTTARLISGMINFTYSWFKPGRKLSAQALAETTARLVQRMVRAS
ncbi:TetR/AcrR family transcriptional regulator [Chelatococcus reniformis]|uniref:TetR family transcriptional regulator n=1 Tax=Chelatococcus reniformis TaxID=1494448 RepID=A0A916XQV5_9HYPH|nr:TetR/AcrR family transcriptional regulator [Chelatococcus reniformis]GGC91933.1 TetR family transcriptional regulator [Chelatococcus reniformis]